MAVNLTLTTAGLAALINAGHTGTPAITIAAVGVSASIITPDPSLTALAGEIKRISAVGGSVVSADTIHIAMQDNSADAYTANSFALYLSDGTLFALYGEAEPIYEKTALSIGMLVADITFTQGNAASISFGATSFANPPASQTAQGVVQLATQAQANAGTDASDVLTPATAAGAAVGWITAAVTGWINTAVTNVQGWVTGQLAGYVTNTSLAAQIGPVTFGSNANGYWEKRANGVLEQWGTATMAGHSLAVTFPEPFLDNSCVVTPTPIGSSGYTGGGGATDGWFWSMAGKSANGFTITGGDASNDSYTGGTVQVPWRAIGRWE